MLRIRALTLFLLLSMGLFAGCSENSQSANTQPLSNDESVGNPNVLDAETSAALISLLQAYLVLIDSDYSDVRESLASLQSAVEDFLTTPAESTLASVRASWIEANRQYELTAIHRYFADTILTEENALEFFQAQYQINHWPILPGYLDYVSSFPESGIVNDMTVSLEADNLREQHGAFDINESAIGFHAIEFLLWGENPGGEDPRPYADFLQQTEPTAEQRSDGIDVSQLSNNRRRQYLQTTTGILNEDFQTLMSLWAEGSASYRLELSENDPTRLLLNVLNGLTGLLTEELLVRSLYPMLNGDFDYSLPSPYSKSSQNAVSSHLTSLETLLLEVQTTEGINLDSLLSDLSSDYAEFFLQNFDASKECLVVLYSGELAAAEGEEADTEFKVVECINLLTNMVDYLEQIKFSLAETA